MPSAFDPGKLAFDIEQPIFPAVRDYIRSMAGYVRSGAPGSENLIPTVTRGFAYAPFISDLLRPQLDQAFLGVCPSMSMMMQYEQGASVLVLVLECNESNPVSQYWKLPPKIRFIPIGNMVKQTITQPKSRLLGLELCVDLEPHSNDIAQTIPFRLLPALLHEEQVLKAKPLWEPFLEMQPYLTAMGTARQKSLSESLAGLFYESKDSPITAKQITDPAWLPGLEKAIEQVKAEANIARGASIVAP
jgi:hypothetical protein